jgi:hypothetical protein
MKNIKAAQNHTSHENCKRREHAATSPTPARSVQSSRVDAGDSRFLLISFGEN